MAALVEAQAHHRVTGLEQREVGGGVGVGAGVGLHVGVLGTEEALDPVAGEVLDLVDDLVAAVVALARVALAVLVRQRRTDRSHDGSRREVLRRDQLEAGVLALDLTTDERLDLGVGLGEGGGAVPLQVVAHRCCSLARATSRSRAVIFVIRRS